MHFTLTPKAPYNFELVSSLYARFKTQCVDLYSENTYKRVLVVKDKLHLVEVASIGTVNEPKLQVKVTPKVGAKKELVDKVRWLVGADDDLSNFYKTAKKDKRFAPVLEELCGLSAPKTPDVFEALIIAITEQQIALPVAIAIRKRLVEKYGKHLTLKGKKYYAFPTASKLANAKPEAIRKLKFSMRKAEYIVRVAQKVASGELDLEKMRTWETQKILDTLTKIKGIGPWTVEYMMCRGMGRYDALPASDIALRSSVTKFLGKKERVSAADVRKFLDKFGEDKGTAAFYLIYWYAFRRYSER